MLLKCEWIAGQWEKFLEFDQDLLLCANMKYSGVLVLIACMFVDGTKLFCDGSNVLNMIIKPEFNI